MGHDDCLSFPISEMGRLVFRVGRNPKDGLKLQIQLIPGLRTTHPSRVDLEKSSPVYTVFPHLYSEVLSTLSPGLSSCDSHLNNCTGHRESVLPGLLPPLYPNAFSTQQPRGSFFSNCSKIYMT